MCRTRFSALVPVVIALAALLAAGPAAGASGGAATLTLADNPNPPSHPVRLIFIHHSTGEGWLADEQGGLGIALRNNNYFVGDTNYGWGPDSIGDTTDIGHWWTWFRGPQSATYLSALYAESGQNCSYSRLDRDPGGPNRIVMFKSCFPNSSLGGNPNDPPATGANPLRGQDSSSEHMTVANAKGIYNDILAYFATRQDKLFVVITAPPLVANATGPAHAANARAFNNWLVNQWLAGYPHRNVAVFDFFNVLTSNGGNPNTHDLDRATGNHHRWWNGAVQHLQTVSSNVAAYGSDPWDSHPTAAGGQKAAAEFVALLDVYYNRWQGTSAVPTATSTATQTPSRSPTATATQRPGTPTRTPVFDNRLRLPVILKNHWVRPPASPTPTPSPTRRPSNGLDVPLVVNNSLPAARSGEPVTSGVPIPRNLSLVDLSALRLLDAAGRPVAAQFTPLARWGGTPADASKPVRWLLIDFQADVPAGGATTYRLVDSGGPSPAVPMLALTDGAGALTVDTGVARFSVSKSDGSLGGPGLSAPLGGRATTPGGASYVTRGPVTVSVALGGPLRASVQVRGAYRDTGGGVLLNHTTRYWFYTGKGTVRVFHTVENNNLCPLGEYEELRCHDIGSGGSVALADLSLVAHPGLGGALTYRVGTQGAQARGPLVADLVLYQDSSGTDYWDHYATFSDWESRPLDARPRLQAYVSFRGYRLRSGATTLATGNQAPGWLDVTGPAGTWGLALRDFWQSFPKALRGHADGRLEAGLFPDEFDPAGYGFSLRAGEHKTHEMELRYVPAGGNAPQCPLEPLFAQAPPAWYVASGAFPFLAARDGAGWPDLERYIDHQLDAAPTYEDWMEWFPNLPAAIEGTDFHGIYDYGDVPLDYEGYHAAPMNLKYHMDYGMFLQWARSGDRRWLRLGEAASRHIADIDILHSRHNPRHWGDGIMFGHSEHDEPGFTNPHRNANSGHPDTAFGVPGLLTTYYLTGYEKAYEAALELADCIAWRLQNDDHLCPLLPAGQCSGAGYALGDGMYGNGCRPAANNLQIVVSAYRATGAPHYLATADALVRWARAADQPYIHGPTGQDMMLKPQMLALYLRALAEYLEVRAEFGLPDNGARASYLAYAHWLRTYPWIDLSPIDTGPRAAFPYEWWFDGRTGVEGEDNDNGDPSINNWLLVGADALAYAHRLSGDAAYLEHAARLFRTGSRDPWFEGDANTYSATKETANAVFFGQIFLSEWAGGT